MSRNDEDWESWVRSPEPGWSDLDFTDIAAAMVSKSFVSGEGSAMVVRYYKGGDGQGVVSKVLFGPRTHGAPGLVHGGAMAAVLDEVMAGTLLFGGHFAFGADLHVHYRQMLPVPNRCVADGRIDRLEGRKIFASARLRDVTGQTVFAEAEALFVMPSAG